MRSQRASTEQLRLLKAVAIVVATLAVVPGVDAVARFVVAPQIANAAEGGISAAYLVGSGDASAALDRIEDIAACDGADLPGAFSDEVGFLPGARDIRASFDGSVVGYVVSLDAEEATRQMAGHMQMLGWTEVPLGDTDGATFMKREGSCRWALATCTQVGAATSVVVRCVIS